MKIMVIGGGGREHTLTWKLSLSPQKPELICVPGNPGMARLARCLPVPSGGVDGLVDLAREEKVHLVAVGPEQPLADGVAEERRREDAEEEPGL